MWASNQVMILRPHSSDRCEVLGSPDAVGVITSFDNALDAAMEWRRCGNVVRLEMGRSTGVAREIAS